MTMPTTIVLAGLSLLLAGTSSAQVLKTLPDGCLVLPASVVGQASDVAYGEGCFERHLPRPAERKAPRLLVGTYLATLGLDATTTHVALRMGAREKVLTQSPILNDAIIGAQMVGVLMSSSALSKTHPRLAKVLLVGSIVFRGAVVLNNLHVIRQMGRVR